MNIPGTTSELIPRRILVVEDHESTALVMQRLLMRHGHQVWKAGNCREAREICQEQPVEVLICDLSLPDGDGWELVGELRHSRPLKAIVMSGHGEEEDRERSRAAGFAAHLLKPLDLTELERTLAEIF